MTSTHQELIGAAPNDSQLFAELRRQVADAGLLRTQRLYYTVKIGGTLLAWAAGWAVLIAIGPSWWQLLVAVYLAECAVQLAFIFHDASHKEISRSKNLTLFIGYTVGNLLLGISFGWWLSHHGQHHNNPNHLELDPDITRKIAVFTPAHVDRRQGWKRWIVKHQAQIYFPFTSLDTLRLRVASVGAIRNGKVKHPGLETTLLVIHAVVFLGAVFWAMNIGQALAFVVLYHVLVGIHLGMAFAPNHKGMPTTDGTPAGWIERQVLTSRNVTPGPFTDYMYGGLNYQIEHHLFPTMPRNNYKRARPIVREFLERNRYPYTETSVRQSLRDITTALRWASEPARQ
mgnify:CR=1 FL=1